MNEEIHAIKPDRRAFTLFELVIVLAIIAAMVTVTMPYATRSNRALKIESQCMSLAESVGYVADLATVTKRPTRLLIDPATNEYSLEIASGSGVEDFESVPISGGTRRYLSRDIRITDMTGFSLDGDSHYLLFEPSRSWPRASISLSSGDVNKTIVITGKRVEVEDSII
jgi:prepilin-type N-terminal cleavage/methylation domain-containing protein